MRLLTLTLAFLPAALHAQTTHNVQVGGSLIGGTPPFFSPQHITIQVGDIVQWNNVSGTHNVNGSTTLFPANPQGFSSGSPQGGSWTFSFTFTIPGVYNYHCTQQGHSATQFGSVTVTNSTGIDENAGQETLLLFPNPADAVLIIEAPQGGLARVDLITVDGTTMSASITREEGRVLVNTESLPAGRYVARVHGVDGNVRERSFLKR